MNTDVEIILADALQAPLLRPAEKVFHAVERRFSRFLSDSELTRLNAASGRPTPVSEEMLELLALARDLSCRSLGAFEPAILDSLEASGYDRSFELLEKQASSPLERARPSHSIADLVLDTHDGLAIMPVGMRLDFGGIGKGFAVDQAAGILAAAGGCIVNAGGDLYAAGLGPEGVPWRVGVASPWDDVDLDQVELRDAAIATSSTVSRRWQTATGWSNHLIDPRTGHSVANGLAAVTVIAPSATEADVFAKSALILGLEAGTALLDSQNFSGLFIREDGTIVKTRLWPTRPQ